MRADAGAWATRTLFMATAALALTVTRGIAGATRPTMPPVAPDAAPPTMFPRGTWDLQLYGTYYESIRTFGDETIQSGVAALGYYFGDRHSFRVELLGYHLDNKAGPFTAAGNADDALAAGVNIGLRYQFLEYERLTLFVEGYAGLFYGHRDFPEDGTHFNFNEQFGLGATFRLRDNLHLVGGARYMHISNAQIHGSDENPTFDGIGGYVGVLFTF